MSRKRSRGKDIRKDVGEAIEQAFPDGVVDFVVDFDEAHLVDVYPKLKAKLSRIKGAAILYERDENGGPGWSENSYSGWRDDPFEDDPFEDPSRWDDLSYSYYVFFVGLTDKQFQFEIETDAFEEESELDTIELDTIKGKGTMGCTVGISLVAPFAAVELSSFSQFEDGHSCPDVESPVMGDVDGEVVEEADYLREMLPEEGVRTLHALRDKIARTLESFGIKVLPEEELRKPVPWLEGGGDAFVGELVGVGVITVRDTFFFRGP